MANVASSQVQAACYCTLRPSFRVKLSDKSHRLFVDCVPSVLSSDSQPALLATIPVVVDNSSQPQVVRTHAGSNVAAMQNAQAGWDFPEEVFPCENVSISVPPAKLEASITIRAYCGSPHPAAIGDLNLSPESKVIFSVEHRTLVAGNRRNGVPNSQSRSSTTSEILVGASQHSNDPKIRNNCQDLGKFSRA